MPRSLVTGGNAYGGVPQLPTTGQLQTNLSGVLNQAIPGFGGLTKTATGIIGDAMAGRLPTDVQNLIQNNAATQAVASGMPGTSNMSGTLFGNRTLRDLGITSLQRQDEGVKNLLGLVGSYSGTVAPNFGQLQEQENAAAQYAAAPDPASAFAEQERLYNKYSNPAIGTIGGGDEQPWFLSPNQRRLMNSGTYSVDPITGAPRSGRYL